MAIKQSSSVALSYPLGWAIRQSSAVALSYPRCRATRQSSAVTLSTLWVGPQGSRVSCPCLTFGVVGQVGVVDLVGGRMVVHQRAQHLAVNVAGRATGTVGEPAATGHTARAQVTPVVDSGRRHGVNHSTGDTTGDPPQAAAELHTRDAGRLLVFTVL